METIIKKTMPYRDSLNTPFDIEVPLEGTAVHIAWNNERLLFELRFLVDPDMPEVVRHFWWVPDGMDIADAVPDGAEWDLNILGTERLDEETVFHVVEGVE